jgi:hypothetical protein
MTKSGFPTRTGAIAHRDVVPPRSVSSRLRGGGSGTTGGTEAPQSSLTPRNYRAGYQIRTGDLQLGKLTLYR